MGLTIKENLSENNFTTTTNPLLFTNEVQYSEESEYTTKITMAIIGLILSFIMAGISIYFKCLLEQNMFTKAITILCLILTALTFIMSFTLFSCDITVYYHISTLCWIILFCCGVVISIGLGFFLYTRCNKISN